MFVAESIAAEIMTLFVERGNETYHGEAVSQLQHMTQCAVLAEMENYPEEIILAALLHDIGHLCEANAKDISMGDFGIMDHELLGDKFLRKRGFSDKICLLVKSHVSAKRYLTGKDPAYFESLSDASKQTLAIQGGAMSPQELQAYEQEPYFELYLKIRRWDDASKDPLQPIPDLIHYKNMLVRHLKMQGL